MAMATDVMNMLKNAPESELLALDASAFEFAKKAPDAARDALFQNRDFAAAYETVSRRPA